VTHPETVLRLAGLDNWCHKPMKEATSVIVIIIVIFTFAVIDCVVVFKIIVVGQILFLQFSLIVITLTRILHFSRKFLLVLIFVYCLGGVWLRCSSSTLDCTTIVLVIIPEVLQMASS